MTQEQLIQEARLEAEKVYPTESYVNDARREGYIQCYIQQAEKRKSEAVKFAEFLLNYNLLIAETVEGNVFKSNVIDGTKYSTEELYDLFLQQHKQELYGTKIQF